MARLPITEAAKVAGVSRVTLFRYIKAGKLSRHPDGTIDTVELQRAGFTLQRVTVTPEVTVQPDVTPDATTQLLATLQQQLEATQALLQQERERAERLEQRYHDRETTLLHLLEQAQLQSQRLLEAPRPAPPAAPDVVRELLRRRPYTDLSPSEAAAAPLPLTDDFRGIVRKRVLQALEGYPEGRTLGALMEAVGTTRPLTNVLTGMYRDGLLVRLARGRYALPERG